MELLKDMYLALEKHNAIDVDFEAFMEEIASSKVGLAFEGYVVEFKCMDFFLFEESLKQQ